MLALEAQLSNKNSFLFDGFATYMGQQNLKPNAGFGLATGIASREFSYFIVGRFLQYNFESNKFLYQAHLLLRNEFNYLIPNTTIFWNSGFSVGISEIKLENYGVFNGPFYEILSGFSFPLNQQTLIYSRFILFYSNYRKQESEIFRSGGVGIEFGLRFSNQMVKPLSY